MSDKSQNTPPTPPAQSLIYETRYRLRFKNVASLSQKWRSPGRPAAGNEDVRPGLRLPCLFSNNSIKSGQGEDGKPASDKAIPDFNTFSKAHKRSACALAWNVQHLAENFGLENLGFLTLTFADHVTDQKEAQRRFNSLASNVLRDRYREFIRVWERTKSGRIHYHLLVVLNRDIRTGFDFAAVSQSDYRTANQAIRDEWSFWRKTAKAYGFGRTELLPVRSTAEGIARYVGKYISKHVAHREERDKGARLVEYTRGARMSSTRFSWNTDGAKQWRAKVALFCRILGSNGATPDRSPVQFRDILLFCGPRWAYHHREFIASLPVVNAVSWATDQDTGERWPFVPGPKGFLVPAPLKACSQRGANESVNRYRNYRITGD